MEEFFSHENQAVPPSLSRDGGLYIGIKSQLMDILESPCEIPSVTPPSDAFIIDGAAMVNSRTSRGQQTFLAYANDVILSYIEFCKNKYSKVGIVFDVYIRNSLKTGSRQKRGSGIRWKVVETSMEQFSPR